MHETSLVAALLRQLDQLVAEHRPSAGRLQPVVTEVQVEIGPLSGVEPILFKEAFRRLQPGTWAEAAELKIDLVALTCHCRSCLAEYQTLELQFVCPRCGHAEVDVVAGDAVLLVSYTISPCGSTTTV